MGAYLGRSNGTIEQAAAEGIIATARALVGAWNAQRSAGATAASQAMIDTAISDLAERVARYDKATVYDGFNPHGSGPEPLTPREEDLSPGGSG